VRIYEWSEKNKASGQCCNIARHEDADAVKLGCLLNWLHSVLYFFAFVALMPLCSVCA